MGAKPTFTRRALNALIAQARGDFAIYRFVTGNKTRFMLFDSSSEGRWSHIARSDRYECFDARDKEAAAAPYCSNLPVAVRFLLPELRETGFAGSGDAHSDDIALRIALAWLRERHGVKIERDQVTSDLPDD